ncbi:MAG: hypothetical protein PHS95_01380 [Candidatus Pacebacteria bacterium]|nr:hypothetical protein [Candidatus Paceibacterota bacterium]
MKLTIKKISVGIVIIFALIGFFFAVVFVGMQFGLFNVRGSIAERNQFFTGAATSTPTYPCVDQSKTVCEWNETPEFVVVNGGLTKDASIITRVAGETRVTPRMIASVVVPEQIRFFTSEREVFKRYFEPLKILGSLSQFSLGVSGIKQETAQKIEEYALDKTSPFYPGEDIAPLISYKEGTNHDEELYNRLTDAKDHYYSYLYTAIFIKELDSQWKASGFDISQNPDAIVTLFNLGFQKSQPKNDPLSGGATIITGGKKYTYGELGADFYRSNELRDIFPN